MPSLRENLAGLTERAFGPSPARQKEQDELTKAVSTLWEAYQEGPYSLPPEQLIAQLREYDSSYLEDVLNDQLYDRLSLQGYTANLEKERGRAVDESRRLYRVDVITQWTIHLWTDFGFGSQVQVVPTAESDRARDTWETFWNSDENAPVLSQDKIYRLSEDLLVDGERFMVYFISRVDGSVIVREIDTKEIGEIVTDPDDELTPLFYKRSYTDRNGVPQIVYYPDFLAYINGQLERQVADKTGRMVPMSEFVLPPGAKRADEINEQTLILVQHIAHNQKGDSRGWPLMTVSWPWIRAHKKFREDRSSVAAAVAMFIAKIKVKGGSRAIDAIRTKLNSQLSSTNLTDRNPAAPAGSNLLENDQADYSKLPLSTGAGDAKNDGESLAWMAALGGGLFPHYTGLGDAYRLATATSMEGPLLRQFTRYQNFWAAQFRKMVRIVLWADEQFGGAPDYDTYDAEVNTDPLLDEDFTSLISALSQLYAQVYFPGVASGLLPDEPARDIMQATWRLVLTSLGVSDVDDIINDESMAEPEPEEEPEPEPAVPPVPPEQPEGELPPEGEPGEEEPADMAAEVRGLTAALHYAMKVVEKGKNGNG
jgi:hypothetical protein